jgi:hypothetical protein
MREGKTAFGDMEMQKENTVRLARVTVGITLIVLLIGLWVCLWVPPSIFSK